jgi:hypothetical protein
MPERSTVAQRRLQTGEKMALVKCQECGKEISDQAANCPHCGAPRQASSTKKEPSQAEKIQGSVTLVLIVAAVIWYFWPADRSAHQPAPASKPASKVDQSLKPEMVLTFKDGNLICTTRDGLAEFMAHAAKGESTKATAMTIENGGGCTMIPPGKKIRLISVEYNDPESDIALLEMVGAEVKAAAHGAWGLSVGAQVVK